MGISDSELYKNLNELFGKYKEFAFKGISQIPYSAVPVWKDFTDGKVEEALKEDKGIWDNIKDYYVITIISTIASIIAFWYITFLVGGMFLAAMGFLVLFAAMLDPVITIAVAVAVLILLLISPAILLLLQTLLVHVLAKIAGGIGKYRQTLSVSVLTSGAGLILMIPMYLAYALIIGLFISPLSYAITIFMLYLQYKGIKHVHKLSPKRAAAVVIGSAAIMFLLSIAIVLVVNIIRFMSLLSNTSG